MKKLKNEKARLVSNLVLNKDRERKWCTVKLPEK